MDFALVISKKIEEIPRGNMVMVMGDRLFPASNNDPYLFRKLVFVATMDENGVHIPGPDNDYKAVLVDPRHLEKVDDDIQKKMEDKFIASRSHEHA